MMIHASSDHHIAHRIHGTGIYLFFYLYEFTDNKSTIHGSVNMQSFDGCAMG